MNDMDDSGIVLEQSKQIMIFWRSSCVKISAYTVIHWLFLILDLITMDVATEITDV